MNNLLVGNGINIQFNKTDYTTQQIVLRILKNCDRDDFPSHIIVNFPYLLKNYIGQLFLEARDILEDKYDNFTNCTAEDESLKSFKKQYADLIDKCTTLFVSTIDGYYKVFQEEFDLNRTIETSRNVFRSNIALRISNHINALNIMTNTKLDKALLWTAIGTVFAGLSLVLSVIAIIVTI